MRRMGFYVLLAAVALTIAGSSRSAAAPPDPQFVTILLDDGSCLFTVGASWRNVRVDHVFGLWFLDGNFLLTTEAPGTAPNAGELTGNKAVMRAGAFAATSDEHTWQVLMQFYSEGAFVGQQWTNIDAAMCAVM